MASISNNEIKSIKALANKKFRDEKGLFVVEGEKMVAEALKSPFEVVSVYRADEIGEAAMARISMLSSPSPVLAVVRKPAMEAPAKLENGLYLALDGIRDPGNMGTIIRIADWFGIKGIFATSDSVDIFNPKVVQSTMGAIFRMDFRYADLCALADYVKAGGGRVYGTFLDGRNIYGHELETGEDSPVVIVVGNESNGISKEMAARVTDRLYIPPYPADDPGSESLNAAVATAVTVAEFRRRLI
ncbi:MAG: RNA methyltransferase [Bacteroidota bacterium]|nr:RNA methyltransferase [Bacteroidota bacterium]